MAGEQCRLAGRNRVALAVACLKTHYERLAIILRSLAPIQDGFSSLIERMWNDHLLIDGFLRQQSPDAVKRLLRTHKNAHDEVFPKPSVKTITPSNRIHSDEANRGFLGLVFNEQDRTVSRPSVNRIPVKFSECQFRLVFEMWKARSNGITDDMATNLMVGEKTGHRQYKHEINDLLRVLSLRTKHGKWKLIEADKLSG